MSVIKNKYLQSFSLVALGLLLGWLIFSPSEQTGTTHNNNENEAVHVHDKENEDQIWTCSMHPQIRQKEEGDCPICGMDLIPLDDNSTDDNPAVIQMSENAIKLANIQTEEVVYTLPEKEIFLNGKIEIDERELHNQITNISGRVEKLLINFTGQYINKGDKIASLYSPELVSAQQELLEAIKLQETMPEVLKSAKQKLRYLKVSDEQINQIINNSKIQDEISIFSDVTGYVLKRNINVGDEVKKGKVLLEVAKLNKLWVIFDVYESDLKWIDVGDQIDFTVASLPGEEFSAKISFIDPFLSKNDRTIKVRAEIRNKNNLLKPEMFVKGTVKTDQDKLDEALMVPKTAVLWTGKRSIVYVKQEDTEIPSFEMRKVTLGSNVGDKYIILDGLEEGENVVSYGVFKIDASAQLAGKYSSMNQPEEKKAEIIPDFTDNTPSEFVGSLSNFISEYMNLSAALVASDSKKAMNKIDKLKDKFDKIDMSLLSHKAHMYWMEKYDLIKKSLMAISVNKEIEKQRAEYEILSNALISSAKAFGVKNKLFIVYCPMANNDKGAFWLSEQNEVMNPYYGDMMLHCGEVKDSITNK